MSTNILILAATLLATSSAYAKLPSKEVTTTCVLSVSVEGLEDNRNVKNEDLAINTCRIKFKKDCLRNKKDRCTYDIEKKKVYCGDKLTTTSMHHFPQSLIDSYKRKAEVNQQYRALNKQFLAAQREENRLGHKIDREQSQAPADSIGGKEKDTALLSKDILRIMKLEQKKEQLKKKTTKVDALSEAMDIMENQMVQAESDFSNENFNYSKQLCQNQFPQYCNDPLQPSECQSLITADHFVEENGSQGSGTGTPGNNGSGNELKK